MRKIDIGCGGTIKRCARGYDVYTDVVMPKDPMPAKFVLCPMEKMPFKDKEFDYARVHHVIEHTENPDLACKELIRIAKSGILSFPPPQAEMTVGRKDHNWYVFIDHKRLLFVPKFHPSLGISRAITGCELNVDFEWKDKFEWTVVL